MASKKKAAKRPRRQCSAEYLAGPHMCCVRDAGHKGKHKDMNGHWNPAWRPEAEMLKAKRRVVW